MKRSTYAKTVVWMTGMVFITACGGGAGNTPPKAASLSLSTDEDTKLTVELKAIDKQNDTLTYTLVSQPSHGKLSGSAPHLTYTPNTNYHGTDRFVYRAADAASTSDDANVTITVHPVNDRPTAKASASATLVDRGVPITLSGSGSDVDGDTLGCTWVLARPAESDAVLEHADQCTAHVTPDAPGTYTATLTVRDASLDSHPVTVTLTVRDTALVPMRDSKHGQEPWITNALAADTPHILKDINTRPAHLVKFAHTPSMSITDGTTLYFVASDEGKRCGLWRKSDSASTPQLIRSMRACESIRHLTFLGSELYFVLSTPQGDQLWRATASSSELAADIRATGAPYPSRITRLTASGGKLYFAGRDGQSDSGNQLWVYDPANGAQALSNAIDPSYLTDLNGKLYFSASDNVYGRELWVSDGTASGTKILKNINANSNDAFPISLTVYNNKLYFSANDGSHGYELWVSDGTQGGTQMLKDLTSDAASSDPEYFTLAGGKLFFAAFDTSHGEELWVTDGTAANTQMVKDLWPGVSGSYPSDFTAVGNRLFFVAEDDTHGAELWVSDGTAANTQMVKDITPGINSTYINWLAAAGSTLYFGFDSQLWVSDGTESGTTQKHDYGTDLVMGSYRTALVGNRLYFFLREQRTVWDEIWHYDTSTDATQPVGYDDAPTDSSLHVFATHFYNDGLKHARVHGTDFFVAYDPDYGYELYKSGGNSSTTALVKDIYPGPAGSDPRELTPLGGWLYFVAEDATGTALYRTQESASSTQLVHRANRIKFLTAAGSHLYFSSDKTNGRELWISDPSDPSAHLLKDIYPGHNSAYPRSLAAIGDRIYFRAEDSTNGPEPWVSDGTKDGTKMIENISAGSAGSYPSDFVDLNGSVCFVANWRTIRCTQGDTGGTVEVVSSPSIKHIYNLRSLNGRLYFEARTTSEGREPWTSDGRAGGTTEMIRDIYSGPDHSMSKDFVALGKEIYFIARDKKGFSLWQVLPGDAMRIKLFKDAMDVRIVKVLNGRILLRVDAGCSSELWSSDGTYDGTIKLR